MVEGTTTTAIIKTMNGDLCWQARGLQHDTVSAGFTLPMCDVNDSIPPANWRRKRASPRISSIASIRGRRVTLTSTPSPACVPRSTVSRRTSSFGSPNAPNPFDILPPQLFNLFTAVGFASLQRHYIAILIRIYNLAEFNRFGLARETVIAEIVDYIKESDAERDVQADMTLQSDPEADSASLAGSKPEHVYAAYLLRRLADSGWIEREQHADYSETIILPDYAFTLLEAFRSIQEQKPREFKGQLYAAHQLITSAKTHKDSSPTLAVSQTYENIRQVVRGLNELNQNIRRYVERDTKKMPVADLLRLQFDDYTQTLAPSYHALKTSDHVSRYRRDIVNQIHEWFVDDDWTSRTAALGDFIHRHAFDSDGSERGTLARSQFLRKDFFDQRRCVFSFGDCFGARIVRSESFRGDFAWVITTLQPIERDFLPAAVTQFVEGNADGDLVDPGGELTATFKGVEFIRHAQQGFLNRVFKEGIEMTRVRRKPAG